MRKFKPRTVYYSAHVLKDGTVWLAVPTRRPARTKRPPAEIDEDGIHQRFEYGDAPANLGDTGRIVWNIAVANSLNTKRIVREQVESKLNDLLERLTDVQQRLAVLESALRESKRQKE
jgi:hypothetical protein